MPSPESAAKGGHWIAERQRCEHPGRPDAAYVWVGRVWQCDECDTRWRVIFMDFGHDVMPGEPQTEVVWKQVAT